MCVRIVFVLVLCCVQSWAQRDPTLSSGFQDRAENPGVYPQGRPPPLDDSEHPDILPQPWPRPIIINNPENTGMPPEGTPPPLDQFPILTDLSEHPDIMQFPLKPMDLDYADDSKPRVVKVKVKYAGVPSNLSVIALPLDKSDHELQLYVSWLPSSGVPAVGYSVEVKSVIDTSDCESDICYQSIQKNVTWVLIPPSWDTVNGGCAIRPGCAYLVKLVADPWDGFTTANVTKELGECEAGVCSCAHSPRLPVPVVSASAVTINNTLYSNVSWYLPTPREPQRLPAKLGKQSYIITLYKQLPMLANNAPYFKILESRTVHVDIGGLVLAGDTTRWKSLPISQEMALKVKIIAKVTLVDARGCSGPSGMATVFAPTGTEVNKLAKSEFSFGIYTILGALIGAFAMGAAFVLSARIVKLALKSFRRAPDSAPLESLIRRPVWFNNYYEYEK